MSDLSLVEVIAINPVGGVNYTVAYLQTSNDIHDLYREYRDLRRDLYDPYGFLEFCLLRECTRITPTKKNTKLLTTAIQFNFSNPE